MRKYAILKQPIENIFKLMIYDTGEGSYLFLYNTIEDKPCMADYWFDNLTDAETTCFEDYKINNSDWIVINEIYGFNLNYNE